jgi:hypothetical protein
LISVRQSLGFYEKASKQAPTPSPEIGAGKFKNQGIFCRITAKNSLVLI